VPTGFGPCGKYGLAVHATPLNQGRISVEAIRSIMGRGFNMGGLAGKRSWPRTHYADGGTSPSLARLAGGNTQPVHLHFDGREFALSGESSIVAQMTRGSNAERCEVRRA